MKNAFFILSLFLAGAATAQKVDLDPFHFNYEYRNLPHTVLDSTLKTYSPLIDVTARTEEFVTADIISSRIVLQGYELAGREADIKYGFTFSDLIIENYEIKESVSESKNKDGSVTKTYSYYINLNYSISATASLRDKSGTDLVRALNVFSNRTFNWTSKEYKNRYDASNYYTNNRNSIKGNLVREKLNEAINAANNWANMHAGFPKTESNLYLWILDNKKHPEYEGMQTRWNALKPALQSASAGSLPDDVKSKMTEMIKYFDGLKATYNKDEKADKKMRYAAYYNNAQLYLLLDMPDKALTEAEGLITNDYDAKDGKTLKEQAEKLTELFNKNNIYTRHFNADSRPYKR
jgi:hypothetical protein